MTDEIQKPSQIELLKQRADKLGITYHPSIGVEKLKAKIEAKMSSVAPSKTDPVTTGEVAPTKTSPNSELAEQRKKATKLIRIRLTCLNPNKKEWPGEIFSVGNSKLGFFKKYVPFNIDEGWHVPQIILNYIQDKQFQTFMTRRDSKGNKTRESKMVKEFAIEILPPLTPAELDDLAKVQMSRI